jgi:hypothetical protein
VAVDIRSVISNGILHTDANSAMSLHYITIELLTSQSGKGSCAEKSKIAGRSLRTGMKKKRYRGLSSLLIREYE